MNVSSPEAINRSRSARTSPCHSGETTSEAFVARFCHNASMRRSLSGVLISWRSIVADMVKEIAAIAGNSIFIAYRTPDRGRSSDCCLRVKRSWKVQLKAGQGFGGLVCSMCYFVAAEALSKTQNSGSIQIVSVLLTCNSTKPLLLKPITRNCRPSASSKMRGVAMPAASCKFAGTLLTLTKSPTLNVCDVFTSNAEGQPPSEARLAGPVC